MASKDFQDLGIAKIKPVEGYEIPYGKLFQKLKVIRYINKILPKLYAEYDKQQKEKASADFTKLSDEDKKKFDVLLNTETETVFGNSSLISMQSTSDTVAGQIINRIAESVSFSYTAIPFLREMSLVSIISNFEEFLKDTLQLAFQKRPFMLKSEKMLTYGEILNCNDMKDLIVKLADKMNKDNIQEDIEDVNYYLSNFFKIDLSKEIDWNNFKERFYRRHIIIHNDGKVDKKYREKTGYGEQVNEIKIDEKYILDTTDLFRKYAERIKEFFTQYY